MKSLFLVAAAAIGLAAASGACQAAGFGAVKPAGGTTDPEPAVAPQYGPYATGASGYATGGTSTGGRYGLLPFLRECVWGKKSGNGCGAAGCGSGGCATAGKGCGPQGCGPQGPNASPYGPYGPQVPGTLVFPNHPYNRGPRDFFMYDAKN